MPDDKAEEFARRIGSLIEEFSASNVEDPSVGGELQTFALTIAYYPSFYFPGEGEESEK
jgi:hypothetical protein